ncbi:hypothetical protein ILUMI_07475 [Ignelater luminosus]|uniref:Sulfatase N-terminal domain-containing protein n=1 Tax=Ignelater luminosus TaxID=2038154 RepID=A0A8K0D3E9_IGNLU|nr:hypothetical protein ILUMI_07475 [Ignelater luminosus]
MRLHSDMDLIVILVAGMDTPTILTMTGMKGFDMHNNFKLSWQTKGKYATELFTEKAEELILMHNESKPLFLMLTHLAAHTGKGGGLEVPDILKNDEEFAYIKNRNRRLYAGMVKELDNSVGSIIQTLSKKGILQNAIVVFFSDNGAPSEGAHLYNNYGSNWPLRGQKTTVLEGGVRVPAIIYTSILKKYGIVSNSLIHVSDLMPTLYAAAGGDVEDLGKVDGVNHWPVLTETETSKRSTLLINIDEVYNSSAIIGKNGRYKLVNGSTTYLETDEGFYGEDGLNDGNPVYNISAILNSPVNQAIRGNLILRKIKKIRKKTVLGNCRKHLSKYQSCRYNDFCLFDLVRDPCETTNIAKKFPLIVKKLERKLIKYWNNMQPQKDIFIDPRANPSSYNNTWYTWLDQPKG